MGAITLMLLGLNSGKEASPGSESERKGVLAPSRFFGSGAVPAGEKEPAGAAPAGGPASRAAAGAHVPVGAGGGSSGHRVPLETLLSQIERHVRLEQAAAESFLERPSETALRAPTASPLKS